MVELLLQCAFVLLLATSILMGLRIQRALDLSRQTMAEMAAGFQDMATQNAQLMREVILLHARVDELEG